MGLTYLTTTISNPGTQGSIVRRMLVDSGATYSIVPSDVLKKLKVKVAMGVGGALDYVAKPWLRAPKLIRLLGLEWLWRLLVQPWRLKRQLALLKFVWLIFLRKLDII